MRRRLARIGLALLLVLAALIVWEPSRVAMQTAVLLPNLLDAGPKPLSLFSASPQRSAITYRPTAPGRDPDLAELWLPAWASAERRAGAMLLVFGVNNVGRNHPAIVRVADGLARTGVAVLVPDSRTLLAGRLEVGEIDGVVRAFQALAARPEVDPARIGIVGFSVGGSLALLAAADARIADEIRWLNAFGAYADAAEYLASVAGHQYEDASGEAVDWLPSPIAREVYLGFLLDAVADEQDRAALDEAYGAAILDGSPVEADAALRADLRTEAARLVHDLMVAGTLDEARAAIAALPSPARTFMSAISPIDQLDGVRASVHLMHELDDHHVPFMQSRALAARLDDAGRLAAHTEFRLFDHVQPDDLDLVAAAPELWKLLWHVHALMTETL
jgi:acetyl esterase/lipase